MSWFKRKSVNYNEEKDELTIGQNDDISDIERYPNLSSIEIFYHGTSIDLSILSNRQNIKKLKLYLFNSEELDLSPLSSLTNLEELSIESRRIRDTTYYQPNPTNKELYTLREIDLSPLSGMLSLKRLSISRTELREIDLSPLSSCNSLEKLSIWDNEWLTYIDLWPLRKCRNLDDVHVMNHKGVLHVNISGLYGCPSREIIHILGDTQHNKFYCDPIYQFSKMYLLPQGKFDKNEIIWEWEKDTYYSKSRSIMKNYSWNEIIDIMSSLLENIEEDKWTEASKVILESFGLEDLHGYNGHPYDMFRDMPQNITMKDGLQLLIERIVNLLHEQIDNGDDTLFLNVESELVQTTVASTLLPKILESRKSDQYMVFIYNDNVDILLLWYTTYGLKILKEMGVGRYVSKSQFKKIQDIMESVGLKIKIIEIPKINIPQSTRSFIDNIIKENVKHKKIKIRSVI